MKYLSFKKWLVFPFLVLLFIACNKEKVRPVPGPVPGENNAPGMFQLQIAALPDAVNIRTDLSVIFSVINEQSQLVITDRKLPLVYDGEYKVPELELPKGKYKLIKFLVVDANDYIQYATPVTPSEKAAAVQKPLQLNLELTAGNRSLIRLEVLKVNADDMAESFGYAAGTFSFNQNTNGYTRIFVHPVIRIGEVVYDSVPMSFSITTWNLQNQPSTIQGVLAAGVNEIYLQRPALKYELKTSKWGVTDVLNLQAADVQNGAMIIMGGGKSAKKIKSLLSYKMVNGQYVPDTKNDYVYDVNGKLTRILYYLKDANNLTYLAMDDHFYYNAAGKTNRVKRLDASGNLIHEERFAYDQAGKIIRMTKEEPDNITTAEVSYAAKPGKKGLTQNYDIDISYHFTKHYFTMQYNKAFEGGNMIKDVAATSHHSSEHGMYQYDFNINPFIHLDQPDIFLSHASKNNIVTSSKQYYGNFPMYVSYDDTYSYDADGYPVQLLKKHKSYQSGEFAFETKTVFVY